ncbi:putative N-acetyltransferase 8B [Erinaceus europaeus]|uniref:N-acetyltransferase 8B n=1 Tax=Erinaceus europaeus TaxID=9365 RepID=A0ABM3X2N9_ERIEU|nr:putative N-acetyltransferase 8B [Erinaceus europaeus]XP_060043074.1 putative N-acetyltransferase 8B [Erinaceus europaeus]XP_060043075.1 putative N-acetyltransferase 8B [Erinaceus europaeus]
MAPYHIRKYQEKDDECIRDLFSKGMAEQVPTAFHHILKLPRTLILLLGGPLTVFLLTGSWLLALLVSLTFLVALRFLAMYPYTQFIAMSLNTDMSDITKNYFSERGSCFWVAESEGQVVGMVGALPVKEPAAREKQLELLHMSVASEYRGQGIAKALVRTVLQFGQDQGYSAVVLSTSEIQYSAIGLYQSMGFQKTHQVFKSFSMRLAANHVFSFIYHLPSVQDSKVLR